MSSAMTARRARWLLVGGPFILGLLLTVNSWGPRPPAGLDIPALVIRADEGLRLLSQGRLDGWSPRFVLGFPLFLHYGQGSTLAVGLVKALTLGLLSTTGSLKVLMALSVAAIAPAVYFLARSVGMTQRAASLASVVALAVNSPWGLGLSSLYYLGLVPHSLAAPVVFVAIGAALRLVKEPTSRRWTVLLAGAIAVVVLTHVLSTIVLPLLLGPPLLVAVLTTPAARRWMALRPVVIGGVAGAGLAAFWLLPFALYFGAQGGGYTTLTDDSLWQQLRDIAIGNKVLGRFVAVAVVAGLVWLARHARRQPVLAALAIGGLLAWVGSRLMLQITPDSPVWRQMPGRLAGYAFVLAIIPLGAMLDAIKPKRVGVALAVAVVAVPTPWLFRQSGQQPAVREPLRQTAEALRRVVPPHARFVMERNPPVEQSKLGLDHADLWLAQHSGRNILNHFFIELSPSKYAGGFSLLLGSERQDLAGAAEFAHFGVSHVVTSTAATRRALLATGEFESVFVAEPLTVFAVRPQVPIPPPSSLLSTFFAATGALEHVSDDSEHWRWRTSSATAGDFSVAISASPHWQARVDGDVVQATQSEFGLINVPVPAGQHTIELEFRRERYAYVGLGISVLTALLLVRWARIRRA